MKYKSFRNNLLIIVFLSVGVLLSGNLVAAATYDATGNWIYSTSNNRIITPGAACELDDVDEIDTLTITQNIDDSVTMIVSDDEEDITFTGDVTDADYDLTAVMEEGDTTVTAKAVFTLSSSTSGSGEVIITADDGVEECSWGFDIALTKEGAPADFDATGNWNFSITDNWVDEGFECEPDDDDTGTATITQNIDDSVTMIVSDDEGDITFIGVVSGSIYILEETVVDNDGILNLVVSFILSSSDAGAGQSLFSWTEDATEICSGGSMLVVTRQSSGGSSGCFIATAAYGSYLEPHVRILRDFRDSYILKSNLGARLMAAYYKYSPPIADYIAEHEGLRSAVRIGLAPAVGFSWIAMNYGLLSAMLAFFCMIAAVLGVSCLLFTPRRE